jgi:hypothetical protein
MSEANRFTTDEWETQLEGIDREIVRHALACRVRLLAPGVVERVLQDDTIVCGQDNPLAFKTLRGLLVMHYVETHHMAQAMGPEQAKAAADTVRTHLGRTLGPLLDNLLPDASQR